MAAPGRVSAWPYSRTMIVTGGESSDIRRLFDKSIKADFENALALLKKIICPASVQVEALGHHVVEYAGMLF